MENKKVSNLRKISLRAEQRTVARIKMNVASAAEGNEEVAKDFEKITALREAKEARRAAASKAREAQAQPKALAVKEAAQPGIKNPHAAKDEPKKETK